MSDAPDITFNASQLAREMMFTVKLNGYKRWLFKARIGMWFVKLGIKIIGCGVKIE